MTHDGQAAVVNCLADRDFQSLNQSAQPAGSPGPATADCFDRSAFDIPAQTVKEIITR
jgi:hypothetical protein